MKKYLLVLIALIGLTVVHNSLHAQCHYQDTSTIYRVKAKRAYAIAQSGSGRTAVSSVRTDSAGKSGKVYVWKNNGVFLANNKPNDSCQVTDPKGIVYDVYGNLYVVQSGRADSNILIYDTALMLIKVIDNEPGVNRWYNPRGITIDSAGNIYVVSDDSVGPGPAYVHIPQSGKLIKITSPLAASPVKSVLLSRLDSAKAVAIQGSVLYLAEYGADKVSAYDLGSMHKIDSVTVADPVDLAIKDCRLYCSVQNNNSVRVFNAQSLHDSASYDIHSPDSKKKKFGVKVNDDKALLMCVNDSNKVFYFRGFTPAPHYASGASDTLHHYEICVHGYTHLPFYHHDTTGYWTSRDTSKVVVDSSGFLNAIQEGSVYVNYYLDNTLIDSVLVLIDAPIPHVTSPIYIDEEDGRIFDHDTVCSMNITAMSNDDGWGNWESGNTSIADIDDYGVVWPKRTGEVEIYYGRGNVCGWSSVSFHLSIMGYPDIADIVGDTTICQSGTINLSDAVSGGLWSSDDPSVASVDSISGVVTVYRPGNIEITYRTVNTCEESTKTIEIRSDTILTAGTITGLDSVCMNSAIALSDTTASISGNWYSSDTSVAAVDSISGIVTGIAAGAVTITYRVTNSCGAFTASHNITIREKPQIIAITGDNEVCMESNMALGFAFNGQVTDHEWRSSDNSIAVVSSDGNVTGITQGSATISLIVHNACGADTSTQSVTVNPQPSAGHIAYNSVCQNSTITLVPDSVSATTSTWVSSDTSIATVAADGVVSGVAEGTATISFTATTVCGTSTTFTTVTVNPLPVAGNISNWYDDVGCTSADDHFSISGASGVGTWSVSDPSLAYINPSSGYIDYYSNTGELDIIYTVINTCGTSSSSHHIAIIPSVFAPEISGDIWGCQGSTGYVWIDGADNINWHISDPSIASINYWGDISYNGLGTTTLSADAWNSCSYGYATTIVETHAGPIPGYIIGPDTVCSGATISLSISPGDRYYSSWWSSENPGIASISSTGVVTGISTTGAFAEIRYNVLGDYCNDSFASHTVYVKQVPAVGSVTGISTLCPGAVVTLTHGPVTGDQITSTYWQSANAGIAQVNATGQVSGIAPGTTNIQFVAVNSCGAAFATRSVTVNDTPYAAPITSAAPFCLNVGVGILNSPGSIGTSSWSSENTAIADVDGTGQLYYHAQGSTVIHHTVTNMCGSDENTYNVDVLSLPIHGFISGTDSICLNAYDTLRNHTATPGGTWRSRHGYVQFVSATSSIDTVVFKGIISGTDTVVYTVTTPCGIDSALFTVRVSPLPLDGTIVGPSSVCVNSTVFLSDPTATPGGTWSSSDPAIATVNPVTGVVAGNAAGAVVITYVGANSCGYIPDTYNLTVNPIANAVINPAINSVCQGGTVALDNTGSFDAGYWVSSAPLIASVNAATGVMGGASVGTATITYIASSTYCGLDTAFLLVTVNPLPNAGIITGPDTVCSGGSISLADVTPGGAWSSGSSSVAAVSGSGVVSGIATSMATALISYTVGSPTCGSASATHTVVVKPLPDPGAIYGGLAICEGATTTLSSSRTGGSWSSASPLVSVNASTGAVTGISAGTALISYAVTNNCGTSYITASVIITGTPAVPVISAPDSFCQSATATVTTIDPGGSWSTHFGYASVISSTPASVTLQGLSPGIDTLTYVVYNGCATSSVSKPIRVISQPSAGFIVAGADSLCPGNTTTLSNPSGLPGGTWGHIGSDVSVTSAGVVTAITPGTDTVSYTVTATCGSAVATRRITVNPVPVAGTITGPTSICLGQPVTLSNTTGTPGGSWSCGSGGTVNAAGVFTGTAPGVVTVSYGASTLCGTLYATRDVTVNPLPSVAAIAGPATVCAGTPATLSDGTAGGFWAVSPLSVATMNTATGACYGVTAGSATVSYSVANSCGTTTVTYPIMVNILPDVPSIFGVASLCAGNSATLISSGAGGTWSSANSTATISAEGLLTGVAAGVDTISYAVSNTCGISTGIHAVTIDPIPGTDSISGSSIVCTGLPVTLSVMIPGGTWAAANGNATVAAGVVTGVAAGVDTIYYAESNSCGAAILNKIITVYTTVTPSVTAVVAPLDTVCGAAPITLTATPVNGGTAPYIEWNNGSSVIGTGSTISYGPSDGEHVWCVLHSSEICPAQDAVYSDTITMHVYPNVIPNVNITVSPSDTLDHIGQPLTFTASLTNCGSSPAYQWYENGTAIAGATDAVYTTTGTGGDAYYCIAACDTPCAVALYNHSNVVTLYAGHVDVKNTVRQDVNCHLFPNPNTGDFILEGSGFITGDNVRYDVVDVVGRMIYSAACHPQNGRMREAIHLTDVSPGNYMLRLVSGSISRVLHFQVQ